MTRTAVAALVSCFIAVSTFAAQTRTYVVGVKAQRSRIAVASHVIDSIDGPDAVAARDFTDFKHIDAFSIEMTDDEAAAMRQQPDVKFVEAALPVHAFEAETPRAPFRSAITEQATTAAAAQTIPWGIPAVHASETWGAAQGAGVNVAIIDTGIDYNHPDLKDEYAGGYNAICATDISCKSTAKINDPLDDHGHGTHVAGIIGAEDNSIGVIGVAPGARIWSVKALNSKGEGTTPNISAAIDWVIGKKTDIGGNWIINMSLGISADQPVPESMRNACQKAADAGILIIAAAGNDSTPTSPAAVGYPASFPTVVAVGATDATSTIAVFSNQGPELSLVAPGVNVLSTFLLGHGSLTYAEKDGVNYTAEAIAGSKRDTVITQFVYCGIGETAADFPGSVRGKIALIQRGKITFNQKTKNAVAAGASAVIIYNCSKTANAATCGNDDFSTTWTLIGKVDSTGKPCTDPTDPIYATCKDDPADLAYPWPVAIRLNNTDGEAIRKDVNATVTVVNAIGDYAFLSGTSMATPHAVGAAALAWSAAPTATASEVRQALIMTAHDLGAANRDPVYGFGLVDAYLAAKTLAPQLFGSGATPGQVPSGRRILRRGGH